MEAKPVKVTENNGETLQFDSLNQCVRIAKGSNNNTKVIVEYRLDGTSNIEAFQLVKATESKAKKAVIYRFSYKDVVFNPYRPTSVETSVNQTTKAEYIVTGTGVFVLFDSKKKQAIPFVIQ